MNSIIDFFADNFSSCVWLAVLIVAMIPTLESKIAIPLAMNTAIWGSKVLSPLMALLLSFVGSILPCIAVMLLARKIKNHTSLFLHSKFLQKYVIKGAKLENKNSIGKYIALAGFVSVPIPLTGVWSGSLISGLSNLKLSHCFCAIAIGAFISAASVTILCSIFKNSLSSIFILSLIIIIAFMFVDLISNFIKPLKRVRHKK